MRNPLRNTLGLKGLARAVGGPPVVTTAFAAASVLPGLYGPVDTTTNAARAYVLAGCTQWFGRIRGSAAVLTVASHANAVSPVPLTVSVDGGAYANVTTASNLAQLFTGLSDDWHTVCIRPGVSYGASLYFGASGNILSVTGTAPAIEVASAKAQTGVPGDFWGGPTAAATANVNFVPRFISPSFSSSTGPGVGSLGFRTSATRLWLVSESPWLALSVDGAAPTYYANAAGSGVIVATDGAAHDYYFWDSSISGGAQFTTLSVGADAAISDLASEKRLHHFGHSIVEGVSATSRAHTDMGRTAARNGYVFANAGVAGNTIQTLLARMTGTLAQLTVSAADVAILDIGRNDDHAGFDSADATDFPQILTALVGKGYGKILVLGPLTQNAFTPEGPGRLSEDIAAAVTALGNPAVSYVSRASYTGITYADGVHPTDAGYVTMDSLNAGTIDPLI